MVKHTQAIRRLLPTNYLSVFEHFAGLALKRLINISTNPNHFATCRIEIAKMKLYLNHI